MLRTVCFIFAMYTASMALLTKLDMNMIQLGYIMTAAYRLRDEGSFVETTLALIIRCDAPYWCLSEHEMISEALNAETPGKIVCEFCLTVCKMKY
jgi:hypothetical protein